MPTVKHKYTQHHLEIAAGLARRGCLDEDIAHGLDVPATTLAYWKKWKPGFGRAIAIGNLTAWKAGLRPDLAPDCPIWDRRKERRWVRARRFRPSDDKLQTIERKIVEALREDALRNGASEAEFEKMVPDVRAAAVFLTFGSGPDAAKRHKEAVVYRAIWGKSGQPPPPQQPLVVQTFIDGDAIIEAIKRGDIT